MSLHRKETTLEEDTKGRYLTFRVDGQLLGFPISEVDQIVGVGQITPIPQAMPYMIGVMNLRGEIISLIDMRIRLGKTKTEYDDRTCIIITHIGNLCIGVVVEGVEAVVNITDADITKPPEVCKDMDTEYLVGLGKVEEEHRQYIVLLTEASKLLSDEVLAYLTEDQPAIQEDIL